jgi:hypothetical protein
MGQKVKTTSKRKRTKRLSGHKIVHAREIAEIKTALKNLENPNRKIKREALFKLAGQRWLGVNLRQQRAMMAPAFKKYLKSKDRELVAMAVTGLGTIREKSAVDALIAKITTGHRDLKLRVLDALRHIKEIKAVRPVIAHGLAEKPGSDMAQRAELTLITLMGVDRKAVMDALKIWGLPQNLHFNCSVISHTFLGT